MQLYIKSEDADTYSEPDVIDEIYIDIPPGTGINSPAQTYIGVHGVASMGVSYLLTCVQPNYYGQNCDVFCLPKDNENGHYSCNTATGAKECLAGYYNPDSNCTCTTSTCNIGTNSSSTVTQTITTTTSTLNTATATSQPIIASSSSTSSSSMVSASSTATNMGRLGGGTVSMSSSTTTSTIITTAPPTTANEKDEKSTYAYCIIITYSLYYRTVTLGRDYCCCNFTGLCPSNYNNYCSADHPTDETETGS